MPKVPDAIWRIEDAAWPIEDAIWSIEDAVCRMASIPEQSEDVASSIANISVSIVNKI